MKLGRVRGQGPTESSSLTNAQKNETGRASGAHISDSLASTLHPQTPPPIGQFSPKDSKMRTFAQD